MTSHMHKKKLITKTVEESLEEAQEAITLVDADEIPSYFKSNPNGRERLDTRLSFATDKAFRMTERMFSLYRDIQLAVDDARGEHPLGSVAGGTPSGPRGGSSSGPSSPVEREGDKLLTPLSCVYVEHAGEFKERVAFPEKWLFVIAFTLEHFHYANPLVECVLNERYIKKKSFTNTTAMHNLQKSEYYLARDIGVQFAISIAVQIGLLKVFDFGNASFLIAGAVSYPTFWFRDA